MLTRSIMLRQAAGRLLRLVTLTMVLVVSFALGSNLTGLAEFAVPTEATSATSVDAGALVPSLLMMALWVTAVVTYVIHRSRWHGWKLVSSVFIMLFGLNTFLPQIESLVFLQGQLPEGMVGRIILFGAIVAGLFSPIAVLILGKIRAGDASVDAPRQLMMPRATWGMTLWLLSGCYVAVYFLFGYFIAWQSPALREFYDAGTPGGFLPHLGEIWSATPWLFPLQALRGLLFVALAVPLVRMLKGAVPECALAVALFFSMGAGQLLLPNPFMPSVVRGVHFAETVSSNFIFGGLVGWSLGRARSPAP
jgi:hypothetical protein